MNALVRVPYELAWRAANALATVVPESSNKIVRTLRARSRLLAGIDAWAGAHRDPSRRLLWIHASSVGESLQALPVVNLFRERNTDLQIVFTFYSPSAEATARRFPVDFATYLPFDTTASMEHVVESLRPSLIVFSKLDVWPNLVSAAKGAGIPAAIISGTVHSASGRRSMLASLLLRDAYANIDSIGAVSSEDRRHIIELGAREDRVSVTGDTRFDQVWARSRQEGPVELLNHLRSNRPTIVAGSTWESDGKHLLPAFADARKAHKRARLIIAPHEPNPANVGALTEWAKSNSMTVARVDDPQAAASDIVILDRMGILGDMYALADIAYVGGGFHRPGLHSVLEPAAFGKPVVFGEPFSRSRDAELLIAGGGARSVAKTADLTGVLFQWLVDSNARNSAGQAARQVVQKGLGAAEASYDLLQKLLPPPVRLTALL
jgi:3-deoxy-D-manno-octulosonic-acid transferase